MSVCKDCVSDIFMDAYKIESSLESAILKVCRMLNIAYVPTAVEAVRTLIDKKIKAGEEFSNAFGFYKSRVGVYVNLNPSQNKFFVEPPAELISGIEEIEVSEEYYDVREFWGDGFTADEYDFLEQQLANFKKTHKSDTYSELVLLREVCFILLEIENTRKAKKSTGSLLKSLQEVMKSLAISPNMANASSASKSSESFGVWIKDIEELEPAEWHENHKLFKDMDNFGLYLENYFVRPLKNFMLGSRDFTLLEEENGEIEIEVNDIDYDDEYED